MVPPETTRLGFSCTHIRCLPQHSLTGGAVGIEFLFLRLPLIPTGAATSGQDGCSRLLIGLAKRSRIRKDAS
jgi:hypothetical protein